MADLVELVGSAKVVLFDFDGPLCDLFAGYPASQIAQELKISTNRSFATDDPLDILISAGEEGSDLVNQIERELTAAETIAAASAVPTEGGLESIHACLDSGRRVGIVSNNSPAAVNAYLRAVNVLDLIGPVIGRAYAAPALMKPNPWPMEAALRIADVQPQEAIFIGDSVSDMEVAEKVGVPCVAYSAASAKRKALTIANAAAVDDMRDFAAAVCKAPAI